MDGRLAVKQVIIVLISVLSIRGDIWEQPGLWFDEGQSQVIPARMQKNENTAQSRDIGEDVDLPPPAKLAARKITGDSMIIFWIPPKKVPGYAIQEYEISLTKEAEKAVIKTTNSTKNQYELQGLDSCTDYTIMVRAIASKESTGSGTKEAKKESLVKSKLSEEIKIKTHTGDISAVKAAVIKPLNSNMVKISFNYSDSSKKSNCADYWYSVNVLTAETGRIVSAKTVPSKIVMMNSLKSNINYTAEISVLDKISSRSSKVYRTSEFFTLNEGSPCTNQSIMNLTEKSMTNDTIELSWDKTKLQMQTGKKLKGYYLRISGDKKDSSKEIGDVETYKIENLVSCVMYTFTLTPYDDKDIYCEPSKELRLKTPPNLPSEVKNLTVKSPDSNQIEVSIEPADDTSTCTITVFEITILEGDKEISRIQTKSKKYLVTSPGIKAEKSYKVSVKATYPEFGLESKEKTADVTTPKASSERPDPPTNVRVDLIRPDSIKISWTAPKTNKTGYILFFDSIENSDIIKVDKKDATNWMIFGLRPCTVYNITMRTKIMTLGKELLSNVTNKISATTKNPNPKKPDSLALSQIGDKALKLAISEEKDKSICASTSYRYHAELFVMKFGKKRRIRKNDTDEKTIEFRDLEPGFMYFASVSKVDTTTKLRGPVIKSRPMNLPPTGIAPAMPTDVQLKNAEAKTMTVEWKAPKNQSDIKSYIVIYKEPSGYAKTKTVASNETSTVLKGLFPCTKYTIQMQTLSKSVPPIPSQMTAAKEETTATELMNMRKIVLRLNSTESAKIIVFGKLPMCKSQFKVELKDQDDASIWEKTYDSKPKIINVAGLKLDVSKTYHAEVSVISGGKNSDAVKSANIRPSSTFTEKDSSISEVSLTAPIVGLDGSSSDFTPALNNKSSAEYLLLQGNFCNAMETFIGNSDSDLVFSGCIVNSFSPGSVIADAQISVSNAEPDSEVQPDELESALTSGIKSSRSDQVDLLVDASELSVMRSVTTASSGGNNENEGSVAHFSSTHVIGAISLFIAAQIL